MTQREEELPVHQAAGRRPRTRIGSEALPPASGTRSGQDVRAHAEAWDEG
jgi:hypothetical protein